MRNLSYTVLLLIMFLNPKILLAQFSAVTSEGKRVVLNTDGTWEYFKEDTLNQSIKHFRNSSWGDSQESVLKSESLDLVKNLSNENMKSYLENIANIEMTLIYNFTQKKLTSGYYISKAEHSNKNSFINDFTKLKKILSNKYGKPTSDDILWYNDLYKDDYSGWGMAISIGHLKYKVEWETDDTNITLILNGDNYLIVNAITYISKKLKHLTEQAENESLEGKL